MKSIHSALVSVAFLATAAASPRAWSQSPMDAPGDPRPTDAGAIVLAGGKSKDTTTDGRGWQYRPFQTWEYFASVGMAAGALGAMAIPVDDGRWRGENGLDTGVRSALRPADPRDRDTAASASDVLFYVSLGQLPFDAMIGAWAIRGQSDVAFQMSLIDLEVVGFTTGVTAIVKATAARERPYGDECEGADLKGTAECTGRERYLSFFSGHTAITFTAASVTCMHHLHLPLYGSKLADRFACVGAYGVAGATGLMRVLADDHHTTDVLTGAAFGTAVGLGLPWLLHYRHPREPVTTGDVRRPSSVSIRVAPAPNGGSILGEF